MSKQKLHPRANSTAPPMMKKLSKRTASKQTAGQPAENDQLSVQTPTPSKTPKKLAQFFASESGKTPDSSKIKLEVLIFKLRSGPLPNEPVHEVNPNDKNEDETSDEIKEVLKIT